MPTRRKILTILFPLVLILVLSLGIAGCGEPEEPAPDEPAPDPGGEEEVYELSLAHFQPSTHEVETILIQDWIDEIEEATDGRVQITSYPGGTLVEGPEIIEAIVDGVADIGHSAYAYTRGRFPVIETLLVPGLYWDNAKVADWTAMEFIEELEPEELEDVKHLFSFTTGRGDLLSQEPVRSMEDLSGLEIGVTAGERADALERLGSTGNVMPMPDQYEAIQRGLTDGTIAPMETLKSFRIAEVVDYVTETPMMYNQVLFMIMNQETWDSFPPDIQETIEEVNKEYYEEVVAGFYDWLSFDLVYEWLEEEGIELEYIELDEEEEERWVEEIEPLYDEHIEYLNEQGFPGEEVFDTAMKLIEENREKYGDN